MSFDVEKNDNHTTIKVQVEKLDTMVAPELKSELVVLDKGGEKNYIIDLSEAKYCDSSGLSALLVANRLSKGANGCMVICGLQDGVQKLIQISQLHTVLNITPTYKEAVDLVFMNKVENDINTGDA